MFSDHSDYILDNINKSRQMKYQKHIIAKKDHGQCYFLLLQLKEHLRLSFTLVQFLHSGKSWISGGSPITIGRLAFFF